MDLQRITPLVLTANEQANIDRTLSRLTWAERIVVVDSYSTDATLETLDDCPQVDVFQRDFDNHHDQWNYGLGQIDTKWALTLDADYVLSEAFVEKLRALHPETDGYFGHFTYCIFGEPLRGSLYPPRRVLFRVEKGRYVQDGHTQRLDLDGPTGHLEAPIYHDDRKPLSAWLEAQKRYAEAEAKKLRRTPSAELGLTDRLRKWYIAPLLMPFYCLLVKRLLLDGTAGWYYTLQRTYAEGVLALRLLDDALRSS